MSEKRNLFASLSRVTVGTLVGAAIVLTPAAAFATDPAPGTGAAASGEKSCGGAKGCGGEKGCGAQGAGASGASSGNAGAAVSGEKSCGGEKGCGAENDEESEEEDAE